MEYVHPAYAWDFSVVNGGRQNAHPKTNFAYAWAVRDGDVALGGPGGPPSVPEPGTMFLLGSGILGLAIARRRFKK